MVQAVMVTKSEGEGGIWLREDDQAGVSATLLLPPSSPTNVRTPLPRRRSLPQFCLPIRHRESLTPLWPGSEQEDSGMRSAMAGACLPLGLRSAWPIHGAPLAHL